MPTPSDVASAEVERTLAALVEKFQIPPAAALRTIILAAMRLCWTKEISLPLKGIERAAIEEALKLNKGSRKKSAPLLGISLRTLQYRLKEYSGTP